MKELVCKMCNSNEIIKQDDLYVCESCGTKYTTEEAEKLFVEVVLKNDNAEKIEALLRAAKRAREIYQTGVTFTECKSTKPVTVAVNEIAENKVSFKEAQDRNEIISDEEVYNKILEESMRN